MSKVDFGYADLRGADLSSADLTGAKFEETNHDETTTFPQGFEFPRKRGKDDPPPPCPTDVAVGRRVRITFGVFAGMEGEIKEVIESSGIVKVETIIFGRPVTVDLQYDDVNVLDA